MCTSMSRAAPTECPWVKGAQVQTRTWERPLPPLDQGELGACTGNGAVGLLSTEPFRQKGVHYTEALARQVYSEATKLDSIVGAWPPPKTPAPRCWQP